MPQSPRTLAILFADIGGSTRLYEQVGDLEAHRRVAESLAFMEHATTDHGGLLLRTVGDASLASFERCDDALLAACAMQQLHRHSPLSVRVGFHFGKVIPDKGDVYGTAVNIAARVASFARVDEITATQACVDCLSDENRLRATLLDTTTVKGVSEAIGIYRIAWLDRDDSTTVIASQPASNTARDAGQALELRHGKRRMVLQCASGTASVGRSSENDLPVASDRASRKHAMIEWQGGQFMLIDQSTNGTFIQRGDQYPVFIRRDVASLTGSGTLGVGSPPDGDGLHVIRYRVLDNRQPS